MEKSKTASYQIKIKAVCSAKVYIYNENRSKQNDLFLPTKLLG